MWSHSIRVSGWGTSWGDYAILSVCSVCCEIEWKVCGERIHRIHVLNSI